MSSASLVSYAYAVETQGEHGVPPNNVDYKQMWVAGGNGWQAAGTATDSAVVDPAMMGRQPTVTKVDLNGGLDFELSFADQFKDLISMGISADGASPGDAWSVQIVTPEQDGELAIQGTGASAVAVYLADDLSMLSTVKVGQRVKLYGFTNAINNSAFTVKSIDLVSTPNKLVFDTAYIKTPQRPTGKPVIPEVSLTTRVASSSMVRNGRTKHTVSILDSRPDLGLYQMNPGQTVNDISFNFQPNELVKSTVAFIGSSKDEQRRFGYIPLGVIGNKLGFDGEDIMSNVVTQPYFPSLTAAKKTQVMEDGNVIDVKSVEVQIAGRAKETQGIGYLSTPSTQLAQLAPKFVMNCYFSDVAQFEKSQRAIWEDDTNSYVVKTEDGLKNEMIISLPNVFLGSGTQSGASKDGDATFDFGEGRVVPFTDSTGATYNIQFERFSANPFI